MPFQQGYVRVEQPAFGQLIRELRHTLKLTQEPFAVQLVVTFPTINRWENGHPMPSRLALRQIDALLQQLEGSSDPALRDRTHSCCETPFCAGSTAKHWRSRYLVVAIERGY